MCYNINRCEWGIKTSMSRTCQWLIKVGSADQGNGAQRMPEIPTAPRVSKPSPPPEAPSRK